MMQKNIICELLKNDKCDKRYIINVCNINNYLEFKHYKFLSGPFKGIEFICNAPDTKFMNKYPNFEVIFISGKMKGIKTQSIITYDSTIQEKTVKWLKLL